MPIPLLNRTALLVLIPGLVACATEGRQGPPAPVVNVTPRPSAMVQPPPVGGAEAPIQAQSVPKPKPAAPVKKATRTFAYREPGSEPEPADQPTPETAQKSTESATGAPPPKPAAPTAAATPSKAAAPIPKAAPPAAKPATPAPQAKPPAPTVVEAAKPATVPKPKADPVPAPAQAKSRTPAMAAQPETPQPAAAPGPKPAPPSADKPVAVGLPPAADSLARQAEQQRQGGDYAGAAASLERSLRIDPRNPYLWNRLARVRMEQGLAAQAGQLASRSNDLAGGQATIKQDNWRIIAEARRRAGDTVGAGQADQKAGGG